MPNLKTYYRPQSLEEAAELVNREGVLALAGGALTLGMLDLPYESVVDLQDLAALKRIERRATGLYLGSIASLQTVLESPELPAILKQALVRSVPVNLRNGASVGESLLTPNPLYEWLAALAVLDARLEYAGQDVSSALSLWEQPVDEFVEFVHRHGHRYPGIITGLYLPVLRGQVLTGSAWVGRTPGDTAIVNAAARVTLGDKNQVISAVVALGGASALPVLRLELPALVGQPLNETGIRDVIPSLESHLRPVSDYRGSYEYRLEMAQVVTRRALFDCLERIEPKRS